MSGFIPGVQGVSANNTIPGHHPKVIVRGHTQHALHKVCHTSLQRPPSPPFRCGPSHHTKTACLRSLRCRAQPPAIHPACLAHCAAAVPTLTSLRPKPTAKAVGYEPPLRSFRSTVIPKSQPHLHSAYQEPPTSCQPNITAAIGRYSDDLPLMYRGGTFEIKSCSFWYPGMIHLQHRSYKWRIDALRTLYGRATDAYRGCINPLQTSGGRFRARHRPESYQNRTLSDELRNHLFPALDFQNVAILENFVFSMFGKSVWRENKTVIIII